MTMIEEPLLRSGSLRSPPASTASDIAWIKPSAHIPASDFGWKAANLCLAAVNPQHIPVGFAVSKNLITRIVEGIASPADLDALRNCFSQLMVENSSPVIVRSSSCVENSAMNSFAGMFQTVRDVRSFSAFIDAVVLCHSGAQMDHVKLYAKLRGTSVPNEHLAILVQQQISVRCSAMVQISKDEYYIEAYEGDLSGRIQGCGSPEYVAICKNRHANVRRDNKRLPRAFLNELWQLTHEVERVKDSRELPANAVLEVASDGRHIYILQLNLTESLQATVAHQPHQTLDFQGTPLTDEPELGLKGASMKYFRRSGLFDSALCVFHPETDLMAIADRLTNTLPATGGFTVRFSHKTDLGLPRFFVHNRDEITEWIQAYRRPGWTTICHPYIDLRHSFELLLSNDFALIEHVPGMWESDNKLDPDVLIIDKEQVRVWRCVQSRPARFARPEGWYTALTRPLVIDDFQSWGSRIEPIISRIRKDFSTLLPLNFHFVEDSKKRWYFLNVRRGFNLELPAVTHQIPHVISDVTDLQTWNRRSPILLRFSTVRGAERKVIKMAEWLRQHNWFVLLVDFGLLSHPAMILRELGFHLVPTYLYFGSRLSSQSYEKLGWPIDRGCDPVERIRREPAIYSDANLRVVRDRDPIVSDHLLVMAEESIKSFADGEYSQALMQMLSNELIAERSKQWILIERGRAQFCTSGFTDKHAHAHLLPFVKFDGKSVDDFIAFIQAKPSDSLKSAMHAARKEKGEYLLVVTPQRKVFIRIFDFGHQIDKRLIRTFFSGRVL